MTGFPNSMEQQSLHMDSPALGGAISTDIGDPTVYLGVCVSCRNSYGSARVRCLLGSEKSFVFSGFFVQAKLL